MSGAPAPIGAAMSFAALQQSGLELGCVASVDEDGRTIWILVRRLCRLPRTTPGALDQSEDQHRYVFDAMHRFRPLVSSDNLCVATLRPAATQGEGSRPRRQRSHRASSAHDPSRRAWRTAGGRYLGRLWIGSVLRQHLTLGTALLMK